MKNDEKQPFLSHLEELRRRLIVCAIAVGISFFICYFFSERLFQALIWPLKANMGEGERLIFTNLPEMFFTYIKTAFVAALMLAAPLVFYEIWMFVAPGLYQREKKYVIPFVVFSSLLFVGGALFGYFVVFPFGFKFFLSFADEYVQALPSVKQYFSLSIKLLFAFGIVFELPIVVFFLAKVGVITPDLMRKKRKYAILLIFVVAAILTPPDVITQVMMAGPLILLYEIGIFVAKMAQRKRDPEENRSQEGS